MIYLDRGCLVKLYYPEPESAKVAALVHGKPICYTPLHELEFINALHLKVFFKSATALQVAQSQMLIAADLSAGVLTGLGVDWDDVFREATSLSAKYSATLGTRSLDILHSAVAKILGAVEFVTSDARQKQLAVAMGLTVLSP